MKAGNYMRSAKHIVMITPGFPWDEADSTCIPALQAFVEALALTCAHYRISVITLHYPGRKSMYKWKGIQVYPINAGNRRFPLRFLAWQKVLRTFKQIHNSHPVDLLHCFWLNEASLLGQRIQKRWGVKTIATLMGQDPLPTNRYLRLLDLSRFTVVGISERASGHLEHSSGRKADQLIPWGLTPQPDLFLPDFRDRKIDILGVGSWSKVKQFEDFLLVVKELVETQSDLKAMLIGEGMTHEKLGDQVEKMGLSKNLLLKGVRPRGEVLETMRHSRILLHTAIYEGQGYVFSEALAAGMSLVSRPVGAATASDRWLIAPNVREMARACLELLTVPRPTTPFVLFPMEETVTAYSQLYENKP